MQSEVKLLEKGKYPFKIVWVDCDYLSKAGNRSVKVVLEVEHAGEVRKIYKFFTKKLDPVTNQTYQFINDELKQLFYLIGKPHILNQRVELVNNFDFANGAGIGCFYTEKSKQPEYSDKNAISLRPFSAKDKPKSTTGVDPRQLTVPVDAASSINAGCKLEDLPF